MKHRVSWLVVMSLFAIAPVHLGADDWPQWRGPDRDGKSAETGLLPEWAEGGPPVAWEIEDAGVGYSSVAVAGGKLLTQGDLDGVEHVICLDARDGRRIWAVQPEPAARRLAERVEKELRRLDRDGDGAVGEAEALEGLRWGFNDHNRVVAGDPEEIAAKRARRLVAALDADKDGRIDAREAGRELRRRFDRIDRQEEDEDAAAIAARRAEALFGALDADGDGAIGRDEARGSAIEDGFRRIDGQGDEGKDDERVTREEYEAYLLRFEAGRDGRLTEEELASFFARELPGRNGIVEPEELRGVHGGFRNDQGDGPRGTPVIEGERVWAEGGNGDLSCLDLATGRTIWHTSLTDDLGGRRPGWGYSESPLIEGKLLIVTPGGKDGALAALDKMTGEVVWRSGEVEQGAHYSSPVAAEIAGKRQVVQLGARSAFGVELDSGKLLWEYSGANNGTANCSTPVVHGDHVFVASAYGTGGGLVEVTRSDEGGQETREVYFEKRMQNHHGGMVRAGNELYGFGSGGLICMDFLTGKIHWSDRSVRKGSLIHADGRLYCLGEGHELALVEATPEGYRERGRIRIESRGRPSWAHPAIAGGRLFIRNQEKLTAYEIRRPSAGG